MELINLLLNEQRLGHEFLARAVDEALGPGGKDCFYWLLGWSSDNKWVAYLCQDNDFGVTYASYFDVSPSDMARLDVMVEDRNIAVDPDRYGPRNPSPPSVHFFK
jgi:hypothetical protein